MFSTNITIIALEFAICFGVIALSQHFLHKSREKLWKKIIAESDAQINAIRMAKTMAEKDKDSFRQLALIHENKYKISDRKVTSCKEIIKALRKEFQDLCDHYEAMDKETIQCLNAAKTIIEVIPDFNSVISSYQLIIEKPEVKKTLVSMGDEMLKNIITLNKNLNSLNKKISQIDPTFTAGAKVMAGERGSRPITSKEEEDWNTMDIDKKIALLEAMVPDKISNQHQLIDAISTMIEVKSLDQPEVAYENSSEALKKVKVLYEKLDAMISEAKKENPEWFKKA